MFRGLYEHTIDAKGRISLPARFRELVTVGDSANGSGRLVVTRDVEPCLKAYPIEAWQQTEAKLAALPSMNRQARMLKRLLVGSAHDLQVDKSGRILLPPPLRTHAGLEREAVFVGQIDHIEIWSKAAWEASQNQPTELSDIAELLESFEGLDI